VREGLRYVWERPALRSTIVLVAVIGLLGQNFRVVLPLLAQEEFGAGAEVYGALMAMLGLGAVLGALATASRRSPRFATLVLAALLFALVTLLASVSRPLPIAYVAMVGVGFANITFNTVGRVLLQLRSEPTMHGRVMALHAWVFLGTTPVGSYLAGWVSELYGPRAGLGMGGVAALLVGLVYLPATRRRDEPAPAASDDPTAQALAVSGESAA
jgi:predicted MFS family arabinose efflux permease